MRRSRLVEVNYFDFTKNLKAASDSGVRIERTDRDRWAAYIKAHEVKEAGSEAIARTQTGASDLRSVIIDGDGAWAGYYLYSKDTGICFRFVIEES